MNSVRRRLARKAAEMCYMATMRAVRATHDAYQPLDSLRSWTDGRPEDAFDVRWRETRNAIAKYDARSLLDIGCAEGYFARRAAGELGILALGIDQDRRRVRVGNALIDMQGLRGCGLLCARLDEEYLPNLPKFDITLCFSVVHHIIRGEGVPGAHSFLRAVGSITGKAMLFDMGSPYETGHEWTESLKEFEGDVAENTAAFLRRSGFQDVVHVGDTPGYDSSVKRPLFVCRPHAAS